MWRVLSSAKVAEAIAALRGMSASGTWLIAITAGLLGGNGVSAWAFRPPYPSDVTTALLRCYLLGLLAVPVVLASMYVLRRILVPRLTEDYLDSRLVADAIGDHRPEAGLIGPVIARLTGSAWALRYRGFGRLWMCWIVVILLTALVCAALAAQFWLMNQKLEHFGDRSYDNYYRLAHSGMYLLGVVTLSVNGALTGQIIPLALAAALEQLDRRRRHTAELLQSQLRRGAAAQMAPQQRICAYSDLRIISLLTGCTGSLDHSFQRPGPAGPHCPSRGLRSTAAAASGTRTQYSLIFTYAVLRMLLTRQPGLQ